MVLFHSFRQVLSSSVTNLRLVQVRNVYLAVLEIYLEITSLLEESCISQRLVPTQQPFSASPPSSTTFNMPSPYQYAPLKGKDDIRILTLLPGRFDDPINITLSHVALSATNVPVFEALSYTWGSPISTSILYISGHILNITSNLFTAIIICVMNPHPEPCGLTLFV